MPPAVSPAADVAATTPSVDERADREFRRVLSELLGVNSLDDLVLVLEGGRVEVVPAHRRQLALMQYGGLAAVDAAGAALRPDDDGPAVLVLVVLHETCCLAWAPVGLLARGGAS